MKILVLISFNSVLKSSLDVFSGESREGAQGARPLLIFRPKWGPMGRKNCFWGHPSHPLISGCGWPGPPLSKGLDPPLVFTHKQYASVELGRNRELKIWCAAEYFWRTLRCFIWWWDTVSNARYYSLQTADVSPCSSPLRLLRTVYKEECLHLSDRNSILMTLNQCLHN